MRGDGRLILILSASLMTLSVDATESSRWSFSGYGTLGYTLDDSTGLTPQRDLNQGFDANRTEERWFNDSRLGAQLAYQWQPQLSLVGQLSLRPQFDYSLHSTVELAYLDWQMSSEWGMRLGRLMYDVFLMAGNRNLGYGYQWVRPPAEYYGWNPLYTVNGAEVAYTHLEPQSENYWQLRLQAGSGRVDVPWTRQAYWSIREQDMGVVSLFRQQGNWQFKLGYSHFRVASQPSTLGAILNSLEQVSTATADTAIGTEGVALRRALSFKGANQRYLSLGFAYDGGGWFGQGEIGRVTAKPAILINADVAYLVIGYHFNALSPYLIYAYSTPFERPLQPQTDWGTLSPALESLQNAALRVSYGVRAEQKTLSLGLRWDLHPQIIVKGQWDYTRVEPYGYMMWMAEPEVPSLLEWHSIQKPAEINLFTVSLDFVF